MPGPYRLGVDIGGTFTDAMLLDEATGAMRICKVPTTPGDPSRGFLEATQRILHEAGVAADDVRYVVHATTVATNAIIEGKLAPTGFITTEGFRDLLEIARQIRPSLYNLHFEKPPPLVPRHRCFDVPERLDADGQVIALLDEGAVRTVARQLRAEGVESVAVCLLHSYVNPAHERRVGEILREIFPEGTVSLSSQVAPEFREYFRASTTVINAGVRPIVARYLERIEKRLREARLTAELLIMQSGGGVFTFAAARERPVFMVESGPAAGVSAASFLGQTLGLNNLLSFDMGGTTAKTGLIENGTPRVTKDYEVGSAAVATERGAKGGGYPIRTPVLDLVEIGAGGGSLAWVDAGGILRVGPHSTGADPGPACYRQGGTEPTITDANVVLGRLDPAYFLGGALVLDAEAAHRAIAEKCARPLGMDAIAAAHGIVEIANAAMVHALRRISVQRGYDPRDFVLVAFGGAGPLHANRLAAELEIPTVLVPPSPGIFSALGLLVTDLKHDYSATHHGRLDRLDAAGVAAAYRALEDQGRAALRHEGISDDAVRFVRQVDLRYVGQSFELAVPVADPALGPDELEQLASRFHDEHERAYGFKAPHEKVELVNVRVSAIGAIAKPRLREIDSHGPAPDAARTATRPVYFAEAAGYVACPVYDRYRLGAGCSFAGPAVVQEMDSTTLLHPGYRAEVDRFGNLLIRKGPGESSV
jgi:N-methylhydantoinase A